MPAEKLCTVPELEKECGILKIVFMGTPVFAVPCLEMLINEEYEIAAVVTQPDRPKGRGNKLEAPPVKTKAMEYGIRVLQPEKLRTGEFAEQLREIKPDLLITVAYGRILPKEVLDIPPLGCINVHASLLPKYRGAAPIQRAVINGDKITGITTMYTELEMDTGDMLVRKSLAIEDNMTYGELHDRLSDLGSETLKETLEQLKKGTLKREPQNHCEATYADMIKKDIEKIDWNNPASDIHNLVRGLNPMPGAFTLYKEERLKIWRTKIIDQDSSGYQPGTISRVDKDSVIVACGKGFVNLLEVQPESCKKMPVEQYIRGHRVCEGEKLG